MDMTELTQVFVEELEEQIQIMDNELLHLEKEGVTDKGIQQLFRSAHTIKGSSAAMGLTVMKDLTHEMEQLLDGVRGHKIELSKAMIDHLLLCLDALKRLKDDFIENCEVSVDIHPLINILNNFTTNDQNVFSSHVIYRIEIHLAKSCEMMQVRTIVIYNKLLEIGNIVNINPNLDEELEDINFQNVTINFHSDQEEHMIKKFIESMMDVDRVDVTPGHNESFEPKRIEKNDHKENIIEPMQKQKQKQKQQTIKVNVERLEHLMNLVGELVIDQTRINQVQASLNRSLNDNEDVEQLTQISDHITRVIANLQDSVMKVRMLPINQLFIRFPRIVRDLSQNLNKQVELSFAGSETELDRTLIEEIGDPLIHLIRNAVDHGIESSEDRVKAGKAEMGCVQIRAAHEDNQIVIVVEDDGAGIDPVKMKKSALEKGMVSKEDAEQMTDLEWIHLIFEPGFSTAETVSEVSGRGVGMDIVRNDIERLNGLIDIQSETGIGTRFTIRLPLTLAIISGLLININKQVFIIPMSNVIEIIKISSEDIQSVKNNEVVIIRSTMMPVIWLHDYFNFPRDQKDRAKISIVVVGLANKRIALAVDDLQGNQDIVIKSLGSYIGRVNCISGSTILGNGRVGLIIEVSDLFNIHKISQRGLVK